MSSVPNPSMYWSFCASTRCSSDNRKKRKYWYMRNVQFHANSHTRNQALTQPNPTPLELNSSFLLEVFSLILELARKIKSISSAFSWYSCSYFNVNQQKSIRCEDHHLHRNKPNGTFFKWHD